MKIAYRISTGEVINDFSDTSTAAGLIGNAVRAGIPENDIEVRDVTKEEYKIENQKIIDAGKPAQLAEEKRIKDLKTSIKNKFKAIGLTNDELAFLFNE